MALCNSNTMKNHACHLALHLHSVYEAGSMRTMNYSVVDSSHHAFGPTWIASDGHQSADTLICRIRRHRDASAASPLAASSLDFEISICCSYLTQTVSVVSAEIVACFVVRNVSSSLVQGSYLWKRRSETVESAQPDGLDHPAYRLVHESRPSVGILTSCERYDVLVERLCDAGNAQKQSCHQMHCDRVI